MLKFLHFNLLISELSGVVWIHYLNGNIASVIIIIITIINVIKGSSTGMTPFCLVPIPCCGYCPWGETPSQHAPVFWKRLHSLNHDA